MWNKKVPFSSALRGFRENNRRLSTATSREQQLFSLADRRRRGNQIIKCEKAGREKGDGLSARLPSWGHLLRRFRGRAGSGKANSTAWTRTMRHSSPPMLRLANAFSCQELTSQPCPPSVAPCPSVARGWKEPCFHFQRYASCLRSPHKSSGPGRNHPVCRDGKRWKKKIIIKCACLLREAKSFTS